MTPLLALDQEEAYHRDGFLIVRGVFAQDEIELLRGEADRLLERTELMDSDNIRCRWQDHAGTRWCWRGCRRPEP